MTCGFGDISGYLLETGRTINNIANFDLVSIHEKIQAEHENVYV